MVIMNTRYRNNNNMENITQVSVTMTALANLACSCILYILPFLTFYRNISALRHAFIGYIGYIGCIPSATLVPTGYFGYL